jgi:hypothetical protein
MIDLIFDKTDKGREEIATRKHHLAPRLRSLLVLVDGKHRTEDLLRKVAGLGLNEQALAELRENAFIEAIDTLPAAATAPTGPGAAAAQPVPGDSLAEEGESQFQTLYNFFTETIRSTLGLRGYALQLKVERCTSIDDFRALRQTYLDAVLKAKGNEMMLSLRERLDQLLDPA